MIDIARQDQKSQEKTISNVGATQSVCKKCGKKFVKLEKHVKCQGRFASGPEAYEYNKDLYIINKYKDIQLRIDPSNDDF